MDRRFRQLAPRSDDPGIWIPFEVKPTDREGEMNWVIPIGRLDSRSSLPQAQAELDVVTRRFERAHPNAEGRQEWRLQLARIKSELVRNARPALLVLQLAVGVVLLLACVNVANLLLARFSARQREVAMRSALGVSVAMGLVFGVVPAMVTTRREAYDLLREGGRAPARSRRQHRLSQALVAVQVSLTLVLLVGAGLLARSFISLSAQPPGFRTSDVTTVRMHVPQARYASVPLLDDYYQRTLERLRSIPGVESVALANNLPISRGHASREYLVEGETRGGVAQYGVVSAGYFHTLDIPLLKGRDFLGSDRRGAPGVAIIDESMQRAVWPLLREGIWQVDPRQPLPEIATLESILSDGVSPQRFHAALLGIFAVIALILVVTGTYGVVAYLVAERTPEFGIRMAMGATGADILARVLRWGLRLAAIGVVLGILGVLVLNRYLASLLFGVTPTDPPTVTVAVALVVLVTLTACLVPAVRASRVDPALALQPDRRVAGEARR